MTARHCISSTSLCRSFSSVQPSAALLAASTSPRREESRTEWTEHVCDTAGAMWFRDLCCEAHAGPSPSQQPEITAQRFAPVTLPTRNSHLPALLAPLRPAPDCPASSQSLIRSPLPPLASLPPHISTPPLPPTGEERAGEGAERWQDKEEKKATARGGPGEKRAREKGEWKGPGSLAWSSDKSGGSMGAETRGSRAHEEARLSRGVFLNSGRWIPQSGDPGLRIRDTTATAVRARS
eukprot:1837887-Rhodomonas_salina.1